MTRKELAAALRKLAERMPAPWDEDRFYSDTECAMLNEDIRLLQLAAKELDA